MRYIGFVESFSSWERLVVLLFICNLIWCFGVLGFCFQVLFYLLVLVIARLLRDNLLVAQVGQKERVFFILWQGVSVLRVIRSWFQWGFFRVLFVRSMLVLAGGFRIQLRVYCSNFSFQWLERLRGKARFGVFRSFYLSMFRVFSVVSFQIWKGIVWKVGVWFVVLFGVFWEVYR